MSIQSLVSYLFKANYRRSLPYTARSFTILGIETRFVMFVVMLFGFSCDDTCAAIIESTSKTVLASERLSHTRSQLALSGISPRVAAEQHRSSIDELVDKCLRNSHIRPSELDAIAATTTPGLVICLKVGADKALAMCRDYKRSFIAVHHMRAHALVARLTFDDVRFPFVALLISGAHSIICVVNGPTNFSILGESQNISPDKVAREAGIDPVVHYGAAVEELAKQSTTEKYLLYNDRLPRVNGADFDFLTIKQMFATLLQKTKEINLPDFCQNLQLIIAGHLCQKARSRLTFR
ncbi:N(6)-L-threonylcarbamoyladenine synthase [Aphelenchoides besseyi]|nr:N(6)-L-threonylcarbamoyladenine synthase [Aphelenchoides besseyi]